MYAKRILYIPEGKWDSDVDNFSGITLYLGNELRKICCEVGIELVIFDFSYFLNTEIVWNIICKVYDNLVRRKKNFEGLNLNTVNLENPLNKKFYDNLKSCNNYLDISKICIEYLNSSKEYNTACVKEKFRKGDILLSVNSLNPLISMEFPIYYFLDISLKDFYFNKTCGVLKNLEKFPKVVNYYKNIEYESFRLCQEVYIWSNYFKKKCVHEYDFLNNKIKVVSAAANIPNRVGYIKRKFSYPIKILFIGRDFERKGGNLIVELLPKLDKRFKIIIVTEKKYHEKIIKFNNVSCYPVLEKQKVCNLYKECDIFLFPTKFEPFGCVVCEAMIFSLPVIASNNCAIPEILGNDMNQIFKEYDVQCLLETLNNLVKDKEVLVNTSRINYLRATKLYQWNISVQRIIDNILRN